VALNRPVTVTVQAFQLQGYYLGKQDVSNYGASSVFSKRVPCYFSYLLALITIYCRHRSCSAK